MSSQNEQNIANISLNLDEDVSKAKQTADNPSFLEPGFEGVSNSATDNGKHDTVEHDTDIDMGASELPSAELLLEMGSDEHEEVEYGEPDAEVIAEAQNQAAPNIEIDIPAQTVSENGEPPASNPSTISFDDIAKSVQVADEGVSPSPSQPVAETTNEPEVAQEPAGDVSPSATISLDLDIGLGTSEPTRESANLPDSNKQSNSTAEVASKPSEPLNALNSAIKSASSGATPLLAPEVEDEEPSHAMNKSNTSGRKAGRKKPKSTEKGNGGKSLIPAVALSTLLTAALLGGGSWYYMQGQAQDSATMNRQMRLMEAQFDSRFSEIEASYTAMNALLNRAVATLDSTVSQDDLESLESAFNERMDLQKEGYENALVSVQAALEQTKEFNENFASSDDYKRLAKAVVQLKGIIDEGQASSDGQYRELLDLIRLREMNTGSEIESLRTDMNSELHSVRSAIGEQSKEQSKLQQEMRNVTGNSSGNSVKDALGLGDGINIVQGHSGPPVYTLRGVMPNAAFFEVPIDESGRSTAVMLYRVGDPLEGYGKILAVDFQNEIVTTESGVVQTRNK